MCLICVDFQRQKLTAFEAKRALGEMREKIGPEHTREVEKMLKDAETSADPTPPKDPKAP